MAIETSGATKARKVDNPWTQADLQKLKSLWDRKVPTDQIARSLNRTRGSVSVKATRLGLPPRAGRRGEEVEKMTKRPCMTCGETFLSEGKHNRICASCKSSDSWMSQSYDIVVF